MQFLDKFLMCACAVIVAVYAVSPVPSRPGSTQLANRVRWIKLCAHRNRGSHVSRSGGDTEHSWAGELSRGV